jgi:putative membrane protein
VIGYGGLGMGAGGWLVMVGFVLLVVGVVVVAAYFAARAGAAPASPAATVFSPPAPPTGDAAEETLRLRFARGEMSQEDFERGVAVLRANR